MNPLDHSLWIWNQANRDLVNQYVEFRHEFNLHELPGHASLYLSADSNYVVWLNGKLVSYGQYHDYPANKAYDCLLVSDLLQAGGNLLCLLGYYQGESSFQYRKGSPGLIYVLDAGAIQIKSGADTYCRQSLAYVSGPVPRINAQLGYTFAYNAAQEDQWLTPTYKMSNLWMTAETKLDLNKARPHLYERPIRKLEIKERCNAKLKTQGIFMRLAEPNKPVAELMQSDFLSYQKPELIFENVTAWKGESLSSNSELLFIATSFKEGTGIYLVYDLGQEECGLLELELEAEQGTTIDIGYGEHLEDLRVRAEVGGRNFASTYKCSNGRQSFKHYFKRMGGRYIQLHISGVKERFVLHYAGLRPVVYPIEVRGAFHCPDLLHQRIAKTAIRTLHLCMHEHYEDTPWREQALYTLDSRNQALCGYYCFGEYDFPQASFELLSEGIREDGFLEICAPAEFELTIPSFSFMWVVEMAEHMLYSGRTEFTARVLANIQQMMEKHIANMQDDLLMTPVEAVYWNFYDWENGLDGFEKIHGLRWDAPLNLTFVMALEAAGFMLQECGMIGLSQRYATIAAKVKLAAHQRFWNPIECAYQTYSGEAYSDHYAELTQALALCTAICPDSLAKLLRERLAAEHNQFVAITLSHSIFKFKALLAEPELYGKLVFDTIGEAWGEMLFNGATSFWETKDGAAAFSRAGSLCHGWSAIPIYFYYAYLLGVQPVEPGFKVFKVVPIPAGFHKISGVVPTPYGSIHVEWDKTVAGLNIKVSHPEGTMQWVDKD